MATIYQIGPDGYWTGATREIGDRDGVQRGWTRYPVPALEAGQYAAWGGNDWSVVESLPAVPAIPIAERREKAALPKAEFCLGLIGLGILTEADAISASKGEWPQAMADFLEYLTPAQAAQVQIEWATRATIYRMNTFVLTLASWAGLADAVVDELFGLTG